ncbi:MAG TPA: hypothetical protein VKB34_20505, partial [Povalibacter sp.]|nr:hypothetical protein [Povalibacter sp.]
ALAQQLPASQLWSLLLWVMQQRAAQRKPATLQQQWQNDRFVAPSYVDQRTFVELDLELLAAARHFESIELSPLAPLGSCSSIALTAQNRIVSGIRGTEVISDPTNVLALESARRLREDPTQVVRFATSHRCVRAQPFPDKPGFAAHFRMFCMTTAGHEVKDQALVVEALVDHIRTHLAGLDRLEQHGYAFPDRAVTLLATPAREPLAQRVAAALSGIRVVHKPLVHEYYNGLRFMINAGSVQGEGIPLIDGGAFDWVAKLTSNRKLVFVASAIGSQLAAYLFRR